MTIRWRFRKLPLYSRKVHIELGLNFPEEGIPEVHLVDSGLVAVVSGICE
jgi:hypothetical protein